MAKPATRASGRRPRWLFLRRPRLYLAIAVGIAVAVLLSEPVPPMRRAVIGWDSGIVLYLILQFAVALRATPQSMRRRAQLEDATAWLFLALMAGAAWFSMFALLGLVHEARGASGHLSIELTVLAGATILLSWVFAHTTFAMHYAHNYYADLTAKRPAGVAFPGGEREPDYWDFLYFSFVVGMTCQVSDVQVASQPWRRLVLAHGIIAFMFNTVVLALSINLLAGLL
jgi:uncharacterized membrane protein